jgi:hypothetical protein
MGIAKITGVLGEAYVQITVQVEKTILDAMAKGPHPKPCRIGGTPRGLRRPCRRQVYTEAAVAENTARMLAKLKVAAEVERCGICGMLHLVEMRPT